MRFEIKINTIFADNEKIIDVRLYTKSDEEHIKDGYESGVYQQYAQILSINQQYVVEIIQHCVNKCLAVYEQEKNNDHHKV